MITYSKYVPSYIESRSPKGLRSLMLKKNIRYGGMIQFFDIQTYVKKDKVVWIAWYYVDMEDMLKKEGDNVTS